MSGCHSKHITSHTAQRMIRRRFHSYTSTPLSWTCLEKIIITMTNVRRYNARPFYHQSVAAKSNKRSVNWYHKTVDNRKLTSRIRSSWTNMLWDRITAASVTSNKWVHSGFKFTGLLWATHLATSAQEFRAKKHIWKAEYRGQGASTSFWSHFGPEVSVPASYCVGPGPDSWPQTAYRYFLQFYCAISQLIVLYMP